MEGGSKSGSEGGGRADTEGGINDILDDNGVEQIRWYQSRMFVFKCQLQRLSRDLWSTRRRSESRANFKMLQERVEHSWR